MFRKSPLRLLLLAGGALGLIFLILLGYASYRLSDVKGPLITLLQDRIDGELKVDSAVVVFFPVGINLKNVRLYAPGEEKPSATIKKAKLRFRLIPLIQKKIDTKVTIIEPEIFLHQDKKGQSNMEKIFAPLMTGEKKGKASKLDELWWKRLAVDKLTIKEAYFKATREGSKEVTELKNIGVKAHGIRFEQAHKPAKIEISYQVPRISEEPMKLKTHLKFQEKQQAMSFEDGKFHWGPLEASLGGNAFLPGKKYQEVTLDLNFQGKRLALKDLNEILEKPLPLSGYVALKGTVKGSAFAPVISLVLSSPEIKAKDISLSNFSAEITKAKKPIEIEKADFGIYGGKVHLSGDVLPGDQISTHLKVKMKSLSLAAMSGKKGSSARLSGNLKLKSPRIEDPMAYTGGGLILVGPFPLPAIDLRNKVRVGEILAVGTGLNQMVNVGMLSNSRNVIGSQIEQIKAKVSIANGNLTLKPFNMGNGHFHASGTANIIKQKTIQGGGVFNLNRRVTAQLITDRDLRNALTKRSGRLSFPFTLSGPLGDPNVQVDSGPLKSQMAKASLILLQKQGLQVDPNKMLGEALKGSPAGDPNNPLGQFLGSALKKEEAPRKTTTQQKKTTQSPSQPTQPKKHPVEQLLFGN